MITKCAIMASYGLARGGFPDKRSVHWSPFSVRISTYLTSLSLEWSYSPDMRSGSNFAGWSEQMHSWGLQFHQTWIKSATSLKLLFSTKCSFFLAEKLFNGETDKACQQTINILYSIDKIEVKESIDDVNFGLSASECLKVSFYHNQWSTNGAC